MIHLSKKERSAMCTEKIRSLLEMMKEFDLVELDLEEENFRVLLKKAGANVMAAPMPMPMGYPALPAAAPAAAAPAAKVEDTAGLTPIKSPIVGTFYRSPSPDAESFVKEGDKVTANSIVCIIEAMKIMNEIKAEISGTVEKVLVQNGEPIEYGQPLFLVRE